MLLLCQHSHYVSADSKLLLYLFSRYDIFYFTFFIISFFFLLILDVPCLYHQPTAKKTTYRSFIFLSFSLSLVWSQSLCQFLPRIRPSHSLDLARAFFLSLSRSRFTLYNPQYFTALHNHLLPAFIKSIIYNIILVSLQYNYRQ